MKKHILFIILSAVAILASCNRVEPQLQSQLGGDQLILSLDSRPMVTKADDAPALPAFETAIDHFDFFFFNDAAGTTPTPGMHGYVNGASTQLNTGVGETYEALRTGTHYVYVLANYPDEIDHTSDWKLADILALEFKSQIVKEKKTEENPVTGKVEETGEVVFCDNLVMDSYSVSDAGATYTVALSPTTLNEEREVVVGLSRVASKINLTLNIAQSVTGTIGDTWTPILQELQAYYVNALNNKSTVGATPVKRAALTDETGYEYFTYPTEYKIGASEEGSFTFVADPVYTYPQTWTHGDNGEPYFKVFLPWMSDKRGSSNFYYKIAVPEPKSGTAWKIDRNICYNVTVDLKVVDAASDYIEVPGQFTIQPWGSSGQPGGNGLTAAKFFDVPRTKFELFSESSVDIPFSSNSTVSAYITKVSYFYYGDTNGANHEYVFNYTVADKVTSLNLPNKDSNNQTLPAAAREPSANTYSVSVEGKNVTFNHPLTKIYTQRNIEVTLVNQEGRSKVVQIIQYPAIEIKKHETKNAFVNGWFGRANGDVRDSDGNFMGVSFTPTTYGGLPSPAYHATDNWNTSSYYVNINSNDLGNLGTVYGSGSSSVQVSSIFTVEIKITAFEEGENTYEINSVNGENYNSATAVKQTREYRIGDPRVPASTVVSTVNIPSYLKSDKTHRPADGTTSNSYGTWEEPLKVLMTNQNADANSVIAPHFLVSSQFNVMNAALSHNNSARRAMTYQEDGYPAGRWRLPTEAEIAFIVARQQDKTIPWLFADTYYHCANGKMFYVDMRSGHEADPPYSTNHVSGYNRFVYDLWYWGDDPTEGVEDWFPNGEGMTEWETATSEDGNTPNWKAHWREYYHPNMHER